LVFTEAHHHISAVVNEQCVLSPKSGHDLSRPSYRYTKAVTKSPEYNRDQATIISYPNQVVWIEPLKELFFSVTRLKEVLGEPLPWLEAEAPAGRA
jgi:hypothetical protein